MLFPGALQLSFPLIRVYRMKNNVNCSFTIIYIITLNKKENCCYFLSLELKEIKNWVVVVFDINFRFFATGH